MPKKNRRVITGNDSTMRSHVLIDEVVSHDRPNVLVPSHNPQRCLTNIWEISRVPVSNAGDKDTATRRLTLQPPPNGAVFRTLEVPPDSETDFSAIAAYFEEMKGSDNLDGNNDRHPAMHRTDTIDFIAVISGEIWLVLDDDEVLLRTGDTAVQRSTNHAWSNRADIPCLMAIVLVAAEPLPFQTI